MTLRKALPAAMIALVFAVPVATWWLVGDLTDPELLAEHIELDYAYRAVSLGAAADRVLGMLACLIVAGTVPFLAWASITRRLRAGWWLVLLPLIVAGHLSGLAARVATAGVIGANIGAGLVLLLGLPVLLVLVSIAGVIAFYLLRSEPQPAVFGK
ncbi:hypothetical protein BJY16_000419 [Actinoplanes octamycinicus]|uniref:Uncharacterized protein n=1 Tax=Actinoplanes octamycinicus TaxID=135948 RepID=A0A7W7GRJ9_9ACTN|nr:hypothetical protein [Actinoplanes octamycinicus]MBB4736960.1 hypothetical protein [Actinoplanes octamycinicus]GIE62098.1 hypothetical protein Aoc01nite_75000 [Actinoplanes octamycinicus]